MAKTATTTARSSGKPPNKPPANMLAKRGSGAVTPDYGDDAGLGKENLDQSDLEIPRIKLIQALSPELTQFDYLRPGMLWHTAAEQVIEQPFIGVPIYVDKRYILWNPRDSGGGILARADDGVHWSPSNSEFAVKLDKKDGGGLVKWKTRKTVQESGLAEWGSMNPQDPNSPPAATLMYSYVLGFPELDLPVAVISFQRSSVRIGRQLNTKIKTVRAPLFAMKFAFSSADAKNKVGQEFKNFQFQGAGLLQPDDPLYLEYRGMNREMTERGLQIKDLESAQDEQGDASSDEPEEKPQEGRSRNRRT